MHPLAYLRTILGRTRPLTVRVRRRLRAPIAAAQGIAAVACFVGGTAYLAGLGWALFVLGGFLLLGARNA